MQWVLPGGMRFGLPDFALHRQTRAPATFRMRLPNPPRQARAERLHGLVAAAARSAMFRKARSMAPDGLPSQKLQWANDGLPRAAIGGKPPPFRAGTAQRPGPCRRTPASHWMRIGQVSSRGPTSRSITVCGCSGPAATPQAARAELVHRRRSRVHPTQDDRSRQFQT